MEEIKQIAESNVYRVILSKPKQSEYKKILLRKIKDQWFSEKYTNTQVFHEKVENLEQYLLQHIPFFGQVNGFEEGFEHMLLVSKKGKITYKKKLIQSAPKKETSFNREKESLLPEGEVIPPLVDMKIMNERGIIDPKMNSKFRQINRFLEMVEDVIDNDSKDTFHIIDCGCGKSYLSFILYYYFSEVKQRPVKVTGIDRRNDVISMSQKVKEKYGYEQMHFVEGNLEDYTTAESVDMVISLHACDTATDYVLANAIRWNAQTIFIVPCCQHEVFHQINTDKLAIFSEYGLLKERLSSLLTDSIRSELLSASGYRTQALEFVDVFDTPKNILLRASLSSIAKEKRKEHLQNVRQAMEMFEIKPTLFELLKDTIGLE